MYIKFTYYLKFSLYLIVIFGCSNDLDDVEERVDVIADFSVPEKVISMSGFLHGINDDAPEDSLISLLNPKLLRSGARFFSSGYEKRTRTQAKQILVIGGAWATGPGNNFRRMPYINYDLYKSFLNDLLDKVGNDVIFDIWNEPDAAYYWPGTREQFFECFKITHDIIRDRFGKDAIISGPSSHFIPDFLNEFMHYCNSANIKLDIFSYHDLSEKHYESVQKNLQYIRYNFVDNSHFSKVGIKNIHVNEYGYKGSHLNPSQVFGYLYNLEEGKADGACRACWSDADNISTCWNGTLGGLLTKSQEPRAAWWAYKLYAESIEGRMQSFSDASFLASFAYTANLEKRKVARLILSNISKNIHINELRVSIKNLPSLLFINNQNKSIKVKVFEIPNTGEIPLDNLKFIEENTYSHDNGSLKISFFGVNPLSNYVLEISEI